MQVDLSAHQFDHGRRAALVRNMRKARAGAELYKFADHVVGATHPGRGDGDACGLATCQCQQLSNIFCRQRGMRDEHIGFLFNHADGRKITHRMVG